jgi:hypothetical protein
MVGCGGRSGNPGDSNRSAKEGLFECWRLPRFEGSYAPIVFSNGSMGGGLVVSDVDALGVSAFSACSCGT